MAAISYDQLVEARDRLQSLYQERDAPAMREVIKPLYNCQPKLKDLAASKIGVLVARLAKDPDVLVRVYAEILLNKWKQFAKQEGVKRRRMEAPFPVPYASPQKSAKSVGSATKESPPPAHRHHPYPKPTDRGSREVSPAPSSTAGPDLQLYEEPARNVTIRRLLDVLAPPQPPDPLPPDAPPPTVNPLDVAVEIEDELHTAFAHEPAKKLLRVGQLRANLGTNSRLRQSLLCGETPARKLVHMKAWELGKWEERHDAHVKAQQEVVASE
jgi:hypothetical protein